MQDIGENDPVISTLDTYIIVAVAVHVNSQIISAASIEETKYVSRNLLVLLDTSEYLCSSSASLEPCILSVLIY